MFPSRHCHPLMKPPWRQLSPGTCRLHVSTNGGGTDVRNHQRRQGQGTRGRGQGTGECGRSLRSLPRWSRQRLRDTYEGLIDVPPDVRDDRGAVAPCEDLVEAVLLDRAQEAGGVAEAQHPQPAAGQALQQVVHGSVGRRAAQHLREQRSRSGSVTSVSVTSLSSH